MILEMEQSEGLEKFGKNDVNSCSTCLKLIFWLIPNAQKSDFVYPIHHYSQLMWFCLTSNKSP